METPKASTLLSLPREVRSRIYHYLCENAVAQVIYDPRSKSVSVLFDTESHSFLAVNRMIYDEALPLYYNSLILHMNLRRYRHQFQTDAIKKIKSLSTPFRDRVRHFEPYILVRPGDIAIIGQLFPSLQRLTCLLTTNGRSEILHTVNFISGMRQKDPNPTIQSLKQVILHHIASLDGSMFPRASRDLPLSDQSSKVSFRAYHTITLVCTTIRDQELLGVSVVWSELLSRCI